MEPVTSGMRRLSSVVATARGAVDFAFRNIASHKQPKGDHLEARQMSRVRVKRIPIFDVKYSNTSVTIENESGRKRTVIVMRHICTIGGKLKKERNGRSREKMLEKRHCKCF